MAQHSDHTNPGKPRPRVRPLVLGLIALFLVAASVAVAAVLEIQVSATVETTPVPNIGDAADDPAIWIHPTDPSLSTIIGTDKTVGGGLGVYDLSGQQLYFYPDGRLNNVDVRYNFPLGGTGVSIVGATNRESNPRAMHFYRVDAATRALTKVGSVATSSAITTPRGFSFYVSPVSGKYYAFVSDVGNIDQYELSGATGSVSGRLVRQFKLPNPTEGLVADDELGRIYVAEENIGGIWRYGGEPGDGSIGVKVDSTTETGGTIIQDVKGLALYYGANRTGYLIAISQGGNSFHLYNRVDNAKVGVFKVVAGAVDGVTGMDGIDVTNLALGSAFPSGLFVTQDTANEGGGNQNFKIVPWQSIANGFSPRLLIDSTWDPRLIGATGGGGDLTPPTTSIDGGPSGSVRVTTASFAFSATEAGATFECALDGGAFVSCSSPREYAGLGEGSHTFRVRAIDAARNVDLSPASRTWSVDLTGSTVTSPAPAGDGAQDVSHSNGIAGASDPCALQPNPMPSGCHVSGGADRTGPDATLSAKRSQELGRTVTLVVGCKLEACVARATGAVSAGGAQPVATGKVTKPIAKGAKATLRLVLSKKARMSAARALGKRKKVTAKLTVVVRDGAGNPTVLRTIVRLRLRRS